ncbi:hypothetical protein JCM15519_11460 [Fundidesulfovibrio butyratiphilus]
MESIDDILDRMEALEKRLTRELDNRQHEFLYTFENKKVRFQAEVKAKHRKMAAKWSEYVRESGVMTILTVPIIWSALLPCLVMDIVVTLYQWICFPIYAIPKVTRADHVILDRHHLKYLNLIEKVNCLYCGYFNGIISYVREVAARTEQYWCPIRHARPAASRHSRYRFFFSYGDAESYRRQLARVRKNFADLEREPSEP